MFRLPSTTSSYSGGSGFKLTEDRSDHVCKSGEHLLLALRSRRIVGRLWSLLCRAAIVDVKSGRRNDPPAPTPK
jgi:hypothetical protein